MGTTLWIVVAMVVVGGAVAVHIGKYPGHVRYSFGLKHENNRRDLQAARAKLRQLEQTVGQERDRARSAVTSAANHHGHRVRQAEQRLSHLRDPGRGKLLGELTGRLRLYENVLEVTVEGRSTAHQLTGISIRDEYSRSAGHVYLTFPKAFQQLLTFPLGDGVGDVEETPEVDVRAFVVNVSNAIAQAKVAKAKRKTLIPQAEAELRLAIADTSGQEQAEQRLGEVTARLKSDVRIPQARRELEAARDRWEELTGQRPT